MKYQPKKFVIGAIVKKTEMWLKSINHSIPYSYNNVLIQSLSSWIWNLNSDDNLQIHFQEISFINSDRMIMNNGPLLVLRDSVLMT